MSKTIMDLPEEWGSIDPILQKMFDVCVLHGNLKVPETLIPKVAKWYGNKDDRHPCDAVVRASRQRVVRTLNTVTFEATQFNELRAKRPVQKPDTASLLAFIEDAKRDCDFCDPRHMTSEDVWGRKEHRYCITAANAAKYDAHHGMVIFGPHHPHRFGYVEVRDYLQAAWSWLQETCKSRDKPKYPFLMWNCLGSAGASLVHGHLHMLTNSRGYYGRQAFMVSRAKAYHQEQDRDYLEDWLEVHRQVDLAREWNGVHVVATMTPVKEKEMIIVGSPTEKGGVGFDFADALTAVLRAFIDALGVLSFNVALYFPPFSDEEEYPFPLLARCVDRGDPSPLPPGKAKTADIGGMELYGSPVVASDPYRVIDAVDLQIGMYRNGGDAEQED